MTKCSLTKEQCGADSAGYWDYGDSCPIEKYKDSTRTRPDGIALIDDHCRYYGIARAKKISKEFAQEG